MGAQEISQGPLAAKLVVDAPDLAAAAAALRRTGKRVVFTNGCFDILHVGHVRCLAGARALGDALIVAVNSDAGVRRSKGEGRPATPEMERAEVLCALAAVDYVHLFDDPTVDRLLELLRPDVYAKGTDYPLETLPERDTVTRLGIAYVLTGDPKARSSSGILAHLRGGGS